MKCSPRRLPIAPVRFSYASAAEPIAYIRVPLTNPNEVDATMEEMIIACDSALDHGMPQVVFALAAVSSRVRVNAKATPVLLDPPNLTELRFSDPEVGLEDCHMPVFKANLSLILPAIAPIIEKIPDSAAVRIQDVLEVVRLALLASYKSR